jgi:hypothetical protein
MRYIDKKTRENNEFCKKVAKRFGLKEPMSYRASRLVHENCSCAKDVIAWIAWDSVRKKCKDLGACTVSEIRDAFRVTTVFNYRGHSYTRKISSELFANLPKTNYRELLADYAQVFRKPINIHPLIEEVRQSLATPAPLVTGEQGLGDPGR